MIGVRIKNVDKWGGSGLDIEKINWWGGVFFLFVVVVGCCCFFLGGVGVY